MRLRSLAAIVVAGGAAAVASVVGLGLYDISATDQHLAPTYWLLDTSMRRSVALRAKRIDVPPLDDATKIARGGRHFDAYCVACHGAPGIAPEPFALGLTPTPANLAHTAREWKPADLFWTIRHGIKMTGMPAWKYRLSDDEIWSIVAFLRVLPTLTPDRYRREIGGRPPAATVVVRTQRATTGDAARGKRAIHQYACATCHAIPGIVGANAPVGPPLEGIATRAFIAGVVPNTPATMIAWLREPQAFRPDGAMPNLGMSEADAADIAAYLATLR